MTAIGSVDGRDEPGAGAGAGAGAGSETETEERMWAATASRVG
jgi:hypothetical protein